MDATELAALLRENRSEETSFVERKPASANKREIRKEACAFANSLPEGREGVIFFGIHDRTGEATGVPNMDSLQKSIDDALSRDCFPPIRYETQEIAFEKKSVLALVIPASGSKPHFSGPAFVRNGSQTAIASEVQLKELVLSHTDKCRELIRYKSANQIVEVRGINYRLGSNKPFQGGSYVQSTECKIDGCSAFVVRFHVIADSSYFSESTNRVEISFDEAKGRPMLLVRSP